jgi:hypothetical protein
MTPEALITLTSARSIGLEFTIPGTRSAAWTVAEAAQACAGARPEAFAALLYSYAGADDCHPKLHRALCLEARRAAIAGNWPGTVLRMISVGPCFIGPPRPWAQLAAYLEDLVTLALLEERQPWRFVRPRNPRTPDPRRVILGLSHRRWDHEVAERYETVRMAYLGWLGEARRQMRHWLAECRGIVA